METLNRLPLTLATCCSSNITVHDFCSFRCVTFCMLSLTCCVLQFCSFIVILSDDTDIVRSVMSVCVRAQITQKVVVHGFGWKFQSRWHMRLTLEHPTQGRILGGQIFYLPHMVRSNLALREARRRCVSTALYASCSRVRRILRFMRCNECFLCIGHYYAPAPRVGGH